MPSFLNKVFGHKKLDDKEVVVPPTQDGPDNTTLLDGKYEAIPHTLFPSASDSQPTKHSDRDTGFSLFKPKLRGTSQKPAQKFPQAVPHLTLHLPTPKEQVDSRALGTVFETDPGSHSVLDDAVIAAKRLDPLEALVLIRACAQAITERGLETLGIMHPHWFSASPDVQRKLISLFIRSLTPQSRTTTLSLTSTSPTSAFENELRYTRSSHDVAAVLRWGLRHLTLESGHFGKETAEWVWYSTFFHAERNASYPPKAFSQLLLPQLPASHVGLLTATLDLIASLASHAEINSISGSKLSKFLGIWLLVATRAEESDDWSRFYARWERSGRILEHLFLARLREESFGLRLPPRLQELVKQYPYNKGSSTMEDGLLSRPRFSTRQYDALCIRIETVLTQDGKQPRQHPVQLLFESFQLSIENPSGDERIALWTTLKTMAFEEATSPYSEGPQFARIFVDETIRLLSLIPADNTVTSPTLLTSPIAKVVPRKRSSSFSKVLERALSMSSANSALASPTSPTSPVITDWAQFSLSGFGDVPPTQPLVAILNQDDDTEVTQPRTLPKSSRQRDKSRSRGRRSEDYEPSDALPSSQLEPESSIVETKLASVHVVQIDEAFIDFWSDAIVDPISADWPAFVLCGLKEVPNTKQPIRWLVIEQAYSRQQPLRNPSPDERRGRSPRSSFKSDIPGFRINTMFSSARKRFSIFSKSTTDLDSKSSGKSPITGELGEVLVEEESTIPSSFPTKASQHVHGNDGAPINSGATTNAADQLKVNEIYASIPPANTLKEESNSIHVTVKASLIEPTPQSGSNHNDSSELPRSSVDNGSLQTLVSVNPKIDNAADLLSVARDETDSQTSDSMVLASEPTLENPVVDDGQIQAERLRQVIVGTQELLANGDELPAEPSGEPSDEGQVASNFGETVETVAISLALESVPVVVARSIASAVVAVDDGPHMHKQPSQEAPTNVATNTAESVHQHEIDNLPPLSAAHVQDKVIDPEAPADSITPMVDGVERATGVAEPAEIPTPVPEYLAFVEETPGLDFYVDPYGRTGVIQVPSTELEASEDTVPQSVAAESQVTLEAEELSIAQVEAPSALIVPIVDLSSQVVSAEAEHAAEQVSELPTEGVPLSLEGPIAVDADTLLVPEVEVDVPTDIVSATRESVDTIPATGVEAQVAPESFGVVETRDEGAPTPVLENTALVDETPGPETVTEEHEPVEAAPAITPEPEPEAVGDKTTEPVPEPEAPAAESTILAEEVQSYIGAELPVLAELSSTSIPEGVTVDGVIADKTEAQLTPDPAIEDLETQLPPDSAPTEDTLVIADEVSKSVEAAPSDLEPLEEKATAPVEKTVPDAVAPASEPGDNTPAVITEEPLVGFGALPSSAVVPQPVDELAHSTAGTAEDPQTLVEAVPSASVPEFGVSVEDTEISVPTLDVEGAQAPVEAEKLLSDVVEAPEAAEIDKINRIVGSSEEIDVLTFGVDVTTQEPAEPSEKITSVEP